MKPVRRKNPNRLLVQFPTPKERSYVNLRAEKILGGPPLRGAISLHPGGYPVRGAASRGEAALQAGAGGESGGQQDHRGGRLQSAAVRGLHMLKGEGGLFRGDGGAPRPGARRPGTAGEGGCAMPSRPDRQRHGAVSLLRLVAPAAGGDAGLWGSASRAPAQPGHPGAAAGHCRTSGGLSGHAGGSGEHPDRRGNGLPVQSSDPAAGAGEGLRRGGAGVRENPENLRRRGRENRQRRHGRPGRYPGESRQRQRAAHFPLPPLSHRHCHPGEPETGAAGLGEPGRKMDYRGRLRLGIPF